MVSWFSDFINLLYPEVCAACNSGLFKGEEVICTRCHFNLPQTQFHELSGNIIEKQFWGKVQVHSATALYFFHKGEKVQQLIHRLKYHGEKEIGHLTGRILAANLRSNGRFNSIDAVIPVPLHPKKLKIRGFNQSEFFAKGIADELNIGLYKDLLVRKKHTSSQTRKSRFSRFENVSDVFMVNPEVAIKPQHILIVDDVVTTGSTLCACAEALNQLDGVKVSVAAIAYASL